MRRATPSPGSRRRAGIGPDKALGDVLGDEFLGERVGAFFRKGELGADLERVFAFGGEIGPIDQVRHGVFGGLADDDEFADGFGFGIDFAPEDLGFGGGGFFERRELRGFYDLFQARAAGFKVTSSSGAESR